MMSDGYRHSKPLGLEDSPHVEAARAAGILAVLSDTVFLEEGQASMPTRHGARPSKDGVICLRRSCLRTTTFSAASIP